jgi:hypothetical protein
MARGEGADAQHQHRAEDPIDPQPGACTSAGARQGQTERRPPVRHPDRQDRPAVQSAQSGGGRITPARSRRLDDGRLRGAVSAHRCAHRGAPGPHLGPRRPRRRPARHTTGAPAHHGLAVRPCRRRHQDPEVAPHPGPAPPVRQRTTCAPNPPGSGTTPRRRRLAGQRPRLRLRGRHTPGRGERPTRLPTDPETPPGSPPKTGHPASCDTASSPCCPTVESPSSRSHGSSGTAEPRSPSSSTPSRSDQSSTTVRPSWTASSTVRRRSHSLSHAADSSNDERPGRKLSRELLARSFVVGDTGIEPVTSSVSTLPVAQLTTSEQAFLVGQGASVTFSAAHVVVAVVVKCPFPWFLSRCSDNGRRGVRRGRTGGHAPHLPPRRRTRSLCPTRRRCEWSSSMPSLLENVLLGDDRHRADRCGRRPFSACCRQAMWG